MRANDFYFVDCLLDFKYSLFQLLFSFNCLNLVNLQLLFTRSLRFDGRKIAVTFAGWSV